MEGLVALIFSVTTGRTLSEREPDIGFMAGGIVFERRKEGQRLMGLRGLGFVVLGFFRQA